MEPSTVALCAAIAPTATVLRKRLTRARLLPFFEKLPPCLIGIEACATSHFRARELTRLSHEVKLMPAQYVKPYVKRQKNDMADAEAIAAATTGRACASWERSRRANRVR